MLNSAIFVGRVFHERYEPVNHRLDYGTFYLLIDLEEVQRLNEVSRLFGWQRRAWFSINESDYGIKRETDDDSVHELRAQYESLLATKHLSARRWRFQILTIPRILGYAFNPISLIYCKDASNRLRAMIYEVNSTFNERIHYVLPVAEDSARIQHQCAKEMFVSPFFDTRGRYEFNVGQPSERLSFNIDYLRDDTLSLKASFCGHRQDFSAANLAKLALSKSNTALKVIAGIHFEALKLWAKGLPIINHVPLVNRDPALGVFKHRGGKAADTRLK